MRLIGKTELLGEKTCSIATLVTINITWHGLGSNTDLSDERRATNSSLLTGHRRITLICICMEIQFVHNGKMAEFPSGRTVGLYCVRKECLIFERIMRNALMQNVAKIHSFRRSPRIFLFFGGRGADLEAIYNLCAFEKHENHFKISELTCS